MHNVSKRCRILKTVVFGAILLGFAYTAEAQWTWTPQTGRWINIKRLPKETAELQIEHARSLMIQGEFAQAIDETEKFYKYYGDSEIADQNQFLRGEIRLSQNKLLDAAKEFQLVVSKYPDSALYDKVIEKQYEIGDKLYQQGQDRLNKKWRLGRKRPFKRAITVYSMVINNQPFTDAAAEAQYKVGLCHHTRKEYVEAAHEYKRVIEDYSTSEWVDEACNGLAECYYDASRPPEYDQEPSQLAIGAIDEFKLRYPNDERVAGLDEKRVKMRETIAGQRLNTARFYEKRRNFNAARVYYEMLAKEFPDTSSGESAAKWLEENPLKETTASEKVLGARITQ